MPTLSPRLSRLVALAGLLLVASGAPAQDAARPDTTRGVLARLVTAAPTWVEMRNVDFHAMDGVVLRIRRLQGEMRSTKGGVVDFDDPTSYVTRVLSAEVGMRGADLEGLMNGRVFAYPGAPLRGLRIEVRDGALRQRGTLHKGVDIPFDLTSAPSVDPDGRIRLRPIRIRIFGVNGQVLMKALGLNMAKMLDLSKAKGVAVQGNDLLLDPVAMLPPPAIQGRLSAVRAVGDELVQVFGTASDSTAAAARRVALPDSLVRNYMYYRGGTLHFGKLFMADAEMLVVDADERDPFDFDNARYLKQLVAGGSRTLPDLGLEVRMPDARAVRRVP